MVSTSEDNSEYQLAQLGQAWVVDCPPGRPVSPSFGAFPRRLPRVFEGTLDLPEELEKFPVVGEQEMLAQQKAQIAQTMDALFKEERRKSELLASQAQEQMAAMSLAALSISFPCDECWQLDLI